MKNIIKTCSKSGDFAQRYELKEILKQEILDKQNEKIEKEKKQQLEVQVRKELIEEGDVTLVPNVVS